MALNLIPSPVNDNPPQIPGPLAHEANDEAARTSDVRTSREASQREAADKINHPTQQKLVKASQGHLIILCGFLALGYPPIVLWEWTISRDIYEVWSSYPILPFLGCVFAAFYASVCLAESSSHFSLFSIVDMERATESQRSTRRIAELYGKKAPRTETTRESKWYLHPITGAIVATLFLFGIYYTSRTRVQMLEMAGEMPESAFQTYLPVVLYAIEIILGIPAFFLIVWVYNLLRIRLLRGHITRVRDDELTLRQSAARKYMDYLTILSDYNNWAEQNGKPQRPLVPPNQNLRQILVEDYGEEINNYFPVDVSLNDEGAPNPDAPPDGPPPPPDNSQNGHGEVDSRVDDLTNLLDEQIDNQNRTL